jgi:magnesium-transporting ATPase (P-type)
VLLQIVAAVREGRRVWDNLRKILLFNLPVNFAQGGSICECLSSAQATQKPVLLWLPIYVRSLQSCLVHLMYKHVRS